MHLQSASTTGRRRFRRATALVAVTVTVALLSACSGGGGGVAGSKDVLTYAASIAPTSIDPVLTNNNPDDIVYQEAAYASLLRRSPKGDLAPDLAVKWGYVAGTSNKQFDLTLRPKAEFADGTPVTGQAVADSLNYFIKNTTGPSAGAVSGMSASALAGDKVQLTSATPNPIIPELLTSYNLLGLVISPAGLKDPGALKTHSFGAGPYVLDPGKTVAGDHYTYTKNKHYYGTSQTRPETLVIKVIPKATSALEALRSGQVDLMYGDQSLVNSAKSYKLNVYAEPHSFTGFLLADRGGNLVPALGNQLVRQAMNYAIDRDSISKAATGSYGKATTQPNLPGWDSYSPSFEKMYPYNPGKAKQLLAQAGYAKGFSMKIAYAAWEPVATTAVQAMAEQLAKVGITVELVSTSSGSQLFGGLADKQYSGIALTWGGQPFAANYASLWAKGGSVNPWNVVIPGLNAAYAKYQASSDTERSTTAIAAQQIVMDQAATVSAVQVDAIAFANKDATGFALDNHGVLTNVADWGLRK